MCGFPRAGVIGLGRWEGARFGGAIGRGGLVEGGRGAENASFGVGEVGMGRDRFVCGVG
jgi:hypothetical protein